MDTHTVFNDLIRFSSYLEPIDLSFNQYLLLAAKPVLIHTGDEKTAKKLLQPLKEALAGRDLAYIFISHFESDECGGLATILKAYPKAKILCSEVTARQLTGFGLASGIDPIKGTDTLITPDYELEFITYPSEMHLWDGLLLIENKRRIFFSSDLVFRPGRVKANALTGDIESELAGILPAQIPDNEKRLALSQTLKEKEIDFIATGHGDCVRRAV